VIAAIKGFVKKHFDLAAIAGLTVLIMAIYGQTLLFDFINLDDNLYVYDNAAIAGGLTFESIRWSFTTFWAGNWHPLTWISHAMDIQLFGMKPGVHHLVNVVFHILNSALVYVVFRRMTGRQLESLIVAALFAIHPTHVESVAWVSERKDVLSTLFWLLTMLSYVKLCRTTVEADRTLFSRPSYWMMTAFFALGLMAKPMLVTLPFVLLLCDIWPLERLSSIRDIVPRVIEKIPLFVLSIGSSVLTFFAQSSKGAVESLDQLSFFTRAANSIVSYAKYIFMCFYPADLAVFYPYENHFTGWLVSISGAVLLAITTVCIWQFKRRPFLLFGWFWFLGTLVPVIGLVQVGSQSLADRYTYVPYIGLFVMIVWGASSLVDSRGFGRPAFLAASAVAVFVLSGFAIKQTSYWRGSEPLYRHALAVTSGNFVIAHNLCHFYMTQNRFDQAEPLCRLATEIRPNYGETYNTWGVVLFNSGDPAAAETKFQKAVELQPTVAYMWVNLARSEARQGKAEQAEMNLQKAIEINGGSIDGSVIVALNEIADAYENEGDQAGAERTRRRLTPVGSRE